MYLKLIIFLFFSVLAAQNHVADFHLKGKVRSLESTTYQVSADSRTGVSGFLDSEFYDAVSLNFAPDGNLVLRKNFLDYRGKLGLYDQTVYQYNPGNQLEKQQTTLVQNGEEPTRVSQLKNYYYLGNRPVRMDEFNYGRTTDQSWTINYKYSLENLTEKEFWMEDQIFSKEIHAYDLTNRLDFVQTVHNNGKPGQRIFFQYDEQRNLKNKTTETGNEKEQESFEYERGVLKFRTLSDGNGKIQLRETYFPNGLPKVVEKINYARNSFSKYEFKYEFDSQYNWINCLILEDENPKFRIVRRIIYY